MLRSLKEVKGYSVEATDGGIGEVDDFLFHDDGFRLRYLVIDTGGFLAGRKVIIPPDALKKPEWKSRSIPVDLTKEEIEASPSLAADEPVSRQQEADLHKHFKWQPYWEGRAPGGFPVSGTAVGTKEAESDVEEPSGDPHLRSFNEILGYAVACSDGDAGEIDDFILDDESWILRYFVIDAGGWLSDRKLILALPWVTSVDWETQGVQVDITKEELKQSPQFDPSVVLDRDFEDRLHKHFGKPGYWT